MKKTLVIILALVMIFAMSAMAMAATPVAGIGESGNFNGVEDTDNTAATEVKLWADAQISATVPLTVTLLIKADGTVQGPGNYTITNTSAFPVKVDSATIGVAAEGDFALSMEGATNKTYIGNITLTDGDEGTATRIGTDGDNPWELTKSGAAWNMAAQGGANTINLKFGGTVAKLPASVTADTGVTAFTITYVVSAGNHVVNP